MRSKGERRGAASGSATAKGGSRIFAGSLRIFRAPAKPISRPLERRFESKYRGRYRFASTVFLIDLALLALAFGLLSVSVSYLAAPVRIAKVEPYRVSISTVPAEPRLGDPVAVTMVVTNGSGHAVGGARLETRFPEGFRRVGGEAAADAIELGDLAAGSSVTVGFDLIAMRSGRLADGATERIFAVISGAGETGAVSYETYHEVRFSGQAVAIDLGLPENASTGSGFEVPITVTNGSTIALGPAELSVCGHGSFTIAGAVEGCIALDLGRLPPGSAATSSIDVDVGAIHEGNGILETTLSVVDRAGRAIVGERSDEVRLRTDMVSLSFGESPAIVSAKDGDRAALVLKDLMGGKPERLDVILIGGADPERVVYAADDADLESLYAGEEVGVTIALPSERASGAGLVAVVRFEGGFLEDEHRSRVLELPDPLRIGFSSAARYFTADGEQLGRGPLPPTVGERTEYWVFWAVAPVERDLERFVISARLPDGVSWSGKQSGGLDGGPEVEYDPGSGIVSWKAVDISKSVAEQGFGVAFAVSVTPGVSDVGKEVELLGAAGFEAVSQDGVSLSGEVAGVATGDAGVSGKGIVIE